MAHHKHTRVAAQSQRGYASIVASIMATTIMLSSYFAVLMTQQNQLDSQETAYFAQVNSRVSDCINQVLPVQNWFYTTTALGTAYDADLTRLCSLPTDKSIQYAISNVITNNGVAYRVLSYWIAPYSKVDATALNRTTGIFTLDPIAVGGDAVSSFQSERARLLKTTNLLESIAHNHQLRFNSLYTTSGDAGLNFFRATSCNSPTAGEIPCSDTAAGGTFGQKEISNINHIVLFGDSNNYLNSWGTAIRYCNAVECGASTVSPFTMIFNTTTPWGSNISVSAKQNI